MKNDRHLQPVSRASALLFLLTACGATNTADTTSAVTVPAAETATTKHVLADARRALGWDALAASGGAVRIVGRARALGESSEQQVLFDGAGRYVESNDGPMGTSGGTDGSVTWTRDWSDTPRVLVLGDRAGTDLEHLFTSGAWTLDRGTLRFEPSVRRESDEIVLDFAHADGVIRGSIRLDAATHRARSATYSSDGTPTRWRFDDYADHAGFVFPSHVEGEHGGHVQTLDATRVERVEHVTASEFAPRIEPPRDARFDASIAPALEVKAARTGHLLIHPLIDGQDLGWFIFDSGAGTNCIANEVTEGLGSQPFGEIEARGVGGSVPARFWRARELRLGPLTIEGPRFMGLDLAFLEPHFGVPVGGILGYELLARCVAEFDMQAGAISIHDPRSYVLPDGGAWEEVLVYTRHPCVRARFEEHEGVFNIDTGAAGDTVTFHYQTVADLGLVTGRETEPETAGGVGGSVEVRTGELANFRLGGRDFGAVPVSFALEDKGAFADDYVAGNIGGKLLEPFRIVFDYPGDRIGFVPR